MTATVAAALLWTQFSCQKPRPAWPDAGNGDFVNAKLTPGTTQVSQEMAEMVQVMPDKLVIPMSSASAVAMKWPVGKPVVGRRSLSGNAGNPFGFMRKVMGVSNDGTNITVQTAPAHLTDVISGSAHVSTSLNQGSPINVDPATLARVFPGFPVGGGTTTAMMSHTRGMPSPMYGTSSEALGHTKENIAPSEVFTLGPVTWPVASVQTSKTYGTGSKAVTVNFQGTANLTTSIDFEPTLTLDFDITDYDANLNYFDADAVGSLTITNTLAIDMGVTAASGTDPTRLIGLEELLNNGPETGSLPPIKIAQSAPYPGPVIVGIDTTFLVELDLDCGWGIQGSMEANITSVLSGQASAGLHYDGNNWSTSSDFQNNSSASVSVTAGGGMAVECGLTARVNWVFADVGGPYVDVRGGVKAHGAVVETCDESAPEDGRPDISVGAGVDAELAVQYGGSVDALDGLLEFTEGPIDIWNKDYPVWGPVTETFPRQGVGWCDVPCQDGMKDGNETDVDCGANCDKCALGKDCKAASDCLTNICSAGNQCVGTECQDLRLDGNETDIDCGGGTCKPCADKKSCKMPSDCTSGICRAPMYGPQICIEDTCFDGVQDNNESDVDCGVVCTTLCTAGQHCVTNVDCASGGCDNATTLCVSDPCVDQHKDGTETDVDCGGSCATKCQNAQACIVGADCASGVCSINKVCVANIHLDGFVDGDETDIDCGGSAPNGCPVGEGCKVVSDCASGGTCNALTLRCVVPGCTDNVKNGNESSVDCGGAPFNGISCSRCGNGKACSTGSDCASGFCSGDGACVASLCYDGAKDGTETDADCGGSCVAKCATGKDCKAASDCASNLCISNVCSSDACKDGVKDGSETDVDCGGGHCSARCAAGLACGTGADCESGLCNAATQKCVASECADGTKDGTETDVDCGGSCSTKCAANKTCAAATDCASGLCNPTTHVCAATTCFDGVLDGNETAIDCGGSCPEKCGTGQHCVAYSDCLSGACVSGSNTCATDQCHDGIQNGNETGVDCGGSCSTGCGVGVACLTNADCANPQGLVGESGYCDTATFTCDATSCTDGAKDGDETDKDCGGSCSPCAIGQGCGAGTDCTSGWCNAARNMCVYNQCQDGIQEANELGLDCGGTVCGPLSYTCPTNDGCVIGPRDCQSGYCSNANLCLPTLPRNCEEVFSRGILTSSGEALIDPDGPYTLNAQPGYGADGPISTWCQMDGTGVAWTPVMYLNSADLGSTRLLDYRANAGGEFDWDMDRNSWEAENVYTCSTNADCATAALSAPEPAGGGVCAVGGHCAGGQAIFTSLNESPQAASVATTSVPPSSYMMNAIYKVYQLRVDVYRDNVLLWSSGPFMNGNGFSPGPTLNVGGNGYYYSSNYSEPVEWLRCYGSELNTLSVGPDRVDNTWDPPYGSIAASQLNFRCHGWATYNGFYNAGSPDRGLGNYPSSWGGIGSVLNIFQESPTVRSSDNSCVFAGTQCTTAFTGAVSDVADVNFLWGAWVRFGNTTYDNDLGNYSPLRMGVCNTSGGCFPPLSTGGLSQAASSTNAPATTPNQVYLKDNDGLHNYSLAPYPPIGGNPGDSNYQDEITNPVSGTELQAGTTGIVIVVWGHGWVPW